MARNRKPANRAPRSDGGSTQVFDVGFAEVFLLSVIGLLVLGPERLPKVARTIGGFVRKARLSYSNLKRTVEAELAAADAANPIKQAKDELESVKQQVADLGKQLDERVDTPAIAPNTSQDDESDDVHPLNPEQARAQGEEQPKEPQDDSQDEPQEEPVKDGSTDQESGAEEEQEASKQNAGKPVESVKDST